MKLLLLSGLLFFSTYLPGDETCTNLKINVSVIHSTNNLSNGRIEVDVEKGQPPYKVYLFAEKPKNNLLDVKFRDLKDLAAGDYILVVQDKEGCNVKENIVVN
jgi:hypothetical protein